MFVTAEFRIALAPGVGSLEYTGSDFAQYCDGDFSGNEVLESYGIHYLFAGARSGMSSVGRNVKLTRVNSEALGFETFMRLMAQGLGLLVQW
jgi:hypothetical protein